MSTERSRLKADCRPWCTAPEHGHTVEWPCLSDDHHTELTGHHRVDENGVSREALDVIMHHDHAAGTTTVHLATPPERNLTLTLAEAHRLHADLTALLEADTTD